MKKIMTARANQPNKLAEFARAYPVRFFFLYGFFILGVFHAVNDLFRYSLKWNLRYDQEYFLALINALGMTFLLPRLPQKISDEQRAKEKKILDQADEIARRARSGS